MLCVSERQIVSAALAQLLSTKGKCGASESAVQRSTHPASSAAPCNTAAALCKAKCVTTTTTTAAALSFF